MISKLLEKLVPTTSPLDHYLQSKQVQTCADIEYWTREFERNPQGNVL